MDSFLDRVLLPILLVLRKNAFDKYKTRKTLNCKNKSLRSFYFIYRAFKNIDIVVICLEKVRLHLYH